MDVGRVRESFTPKRLRFGERSKLAALSFRSAHAAEAGSEEICDARRKLGTKRFATKEVSMLKVLNETILSVCFLSVTSTVLDLLLPSGEMSKYAKFVMGVLITVCLVRAPLMLFYA
jgi:hypothetical protein